MRLAAIAALFVLTSAVAADAAEQAAKRPYWSSIRAGQARMRAGPARTYPASWLYRRADLPVRVVDSFKEWRKIEDPDGTQGWMLANLLSATRTAIVRGPEPASMRERPIADARLMWRAAPGVVGRVSACRDGWCRLDVKGRAGFVAVESIWGVDATETLP